MMYYFDPGPTRRLGSKSEVHSELAVFYFVFEHQQFFLVSWRYPKKENVSNNKLSLLQLVL